MSNELERVHESGRKMNLFWLGITCLSLTYCLFGAFIDQPTMLQNWRGWALAILSALFLFWYAIWFWSKVYQCSPMKNAWPPPLWFAALRWGITFALVCALTALHPLMGWLFWAVFGLAFGLFIPPWVLLPTILSSLGIFYTLLATANPPPEALPWIIFSMALVFLSVGYSSYLPGRMIRERMQREHVFLDLEDAHRQLADAHRQLELSAEREAELAVFSERSRLAREMHDTIGHALVLIAVKLEAAQRLRAVNPERADHEIEATKEIVRSTMSEMRASLANLRAPISSQQSIADMLARRARESSERAGFYVTYQMPDDLGEICAPVREALYRIGAEALTNIEKHAHAHAVRLSLARCAESITLQIEDDGVGLPALITARQRAAFQPAQLSSPPGHYGITGMRERVEALGGRLTLAPRINGGTIVEASIPLSAALN
jgi:signal transduction histidine kinase